MLVNDMQENRYQTMPPQWFALWMQIKQFCVVGTVSVSLNPAISLREEVEFNSNSKNVKKNCIRLQARTTTLTERRMAHSSMGQATMVSCA